MTIDQFIALVGAVAGLIALVLKTWLEVRKVHTLVNSRMTELLELTRVAARAAGVKEGEHPLTLPPSELPRQLE